MILQQQKAVSIEHKVLEYCAERYKKNQFLTTIIKKFLTTKKIDLNIIKGNCLK
jgi:hypothetical protein